MSLAGLKSGAIIAGAAIGGGAVIGAGIGAVRSLNSEPTPSASGFNSTEKRSVLADALIGAGIGAVGGVALLGARNLMPVLNRVPILGNASAPAMIALGIGTGAASMGAYSLGRNVLN